MCFFKTKKSKVLVAKRNIKVYKIGTYANGTSFNPFVYHAFEYHVNRIVFTEVAFTNVINWGFHSYINCKLVSSTTDINFYSCKKLLFCISLLDTVYFGEFIIPKGATYCLNINGEAVSDKLMYTGNYVKIHSGKTYNPKELWTRS